LELGHHSLALDAELLREFVNPDLRHYAPSTRPGFRASQPVRGSACSVRRQFLLFIAACSSSAHHNLSLSFRHILLPPEFLAAIAHKASRIAAAVSGRAPVRSRRDT